MNPLKTSDCACGASRPVMLSERDERLLVRYFDGEAGWFDRVRAQRLVRRKAEAREFMDTMHVIGEIARNERAGILSSNAQPADLWSRIEQRIDAEERAALFLGSRAAQGKRSSWQLRMTEFFAVDRIIWGSSGAVLAACLMFALVQQPRQATSSSAGAMQVADERSSSGSSTGSSSVRRVSSRDRSPARRFASDDQLYTEPLRILEKELPSALEVDWMKSDGRVRMMQDPGDRSAIIWVKRRPMNMALQNRSVQDRFVQDRPVVVYGDRIPGSIGVTHR